MTALPADDERLYRVAVEFGDCDPAGIVFFPNFHRWMDASSRHWFVTRGIASWRDTDARWGIVGTPIVDSQTTFKRPAAYGDRLHIDTRVIEWRHKSFVMRHRIWRGEDLLVEGTEVRVFAIRGERPGTVRAVAPPDEIRALEP